MTTSSFKKLCNVYGSRYVRFLNVPYRSVYPNASEAEFLNKYVGLMYSMLFYNVYVKLTLLFANYCSVYYVSSCF